MTQAWRHNDVANGNYAFYHEHGAGDIGLQDPVFLKRVKEAGLDPVKNPKEVGAKWIDENIWHGETHYWEHLPWLMEEWKRISGGKPFILKGVQSVEDAKKCVEVGVDGIVVTNHAGRQVDGAIGSLDALEAIVDAVGDRTYVRSLWRPTAERNIADKRSDQTMFDSGVRTGANVFKALALGAKFVFVGRLWVWGLGIAGVIGVRHIMKSVLADFDILINVAGFQNVKQITRDAIRTLPSSSALPLASDEFQLS